MPLFWDLVVIKLIGTGNYLNIVFVLRTIKYFTKLPQTALKF